MLLKAITAARDLGRLQEIGRVLVRHGFGDLVHRTGIASALQRAGRALHLTQGPPSEALPAPVRVRMALEELGAAFVKLGQVLASRPDLLAPDWIDELSKLHEHVAPVPFEDLRSQLEDDLGARPEDVFTRLDSQPLASGSIGQVHRAALADGRDVVLKIRRPGIGAEVTADLRLLGHLALVLERDVAEFRRYGPRRIVRQFANVMRAELDFRIEAKNQAVLARDLADHPAVVVPEIHDEFTRETLLVLEFLDGISASAWLRDRSLGEFDGPALARVGTDAILDAVLEHGRYHADPHPGNVLFLPGGRIGLLDFGMVGRLSDTRRRQFAGLLGAVVERDDAALVDLLLDWSPSGDADVEMLEQDCAAFLDRYQGVPLRDLDVTAVLRDVTEVVRQNDLSLPTDVTMLVKVFVTLEGLGRALDPDFDMAAHVEPAARRMMQALYSPRAVARRGISEVRKLLTELPRELRAVVTRARRGGFKVEFELRRLQEFGDQIDRSANRITIGLIVSALIVGTSIAMTVDTGPQLFGVPFIALIGFLSSLMVGAALLWAMIRSGRH